MYNLRSGSSANSRKMFGDISNSTQNSDAHVEEGKKLSVCFSAKDKSSAAVVSNRRRQEPCGRGVAAPKGARVAKKERVGATSRATLTVGTNLAPYAVNSDQYSAPADDIDSLDLDEPLLVTGHFEEMYGHYREIEAKLAIQPDYMEHQHDINKTMRSIIIDWLVTVHQDFRLVPETLYLTVALIDRFLQRVAIVRSELQLVGVACLLVASEYEDFYPPELHKLVYICDDRYTKDQIITMEQKVLETLGYQVTIASAHTFLARYLKAADADTKVVQTACYILEGTLQSYELLRYLPSQLAAAAVWVARKQSGRNAWSPTLLKYANYSEEDVVPVAQDVLQKKATATPRLRSVDKKYSTAKFGAVSRTSYATL